MVYKNPEGYINIGIIKAKNNEFEEAINCFRACNKNKTECQPKPMHFLGSVYSEISDFKRQKAFEVSLKLDSRNSQTYINQAIF